MLRKSRHEPVRPLEWTSLVQGLSERANRHPEREALSFLGDEGDEVHLTYGELDERATSLASKIAATAAPGDRALLLFPPGAEFLVGFLACQYARVIPVPTCFPKPGRSMPRLDAAASDCSPAFLIADAATLEGIDRRRVGESVNQSTWIASDESRQSDSGLWRPDFDAIAGDDLGLLQYTSGSTSQPKGVMVRHRNLMSNLEAIRNAFEIQFAADDSDEVTCGVFWLPPFHDMGLIGGLLEALYVGGRTVLMSPRSFLHRPMRWLETIARFKAKISGAPNFAYQLCVDRVTPDMAATLDLSHWELAFCGAEPVSSETLEQFARRFGRSGFRGRAFCPCYGLAEATLLASGSVDGVDTVGTAGSTCLDLDRDELTSGSIHVLDQSNIEAIASTELRQELPATTRRLVSCGTPGLGISIAIVDPDTCVATKPNRVGEIWLQGPSVADGYYRRDDLNQVQFGARQADAPHLGGFCRTGDLGFMLDGQVYVTGRMKDVIILRGRNHFPQDIEASVRDAMTDRVVQCVAIRSVPRSGALDTTVSDSLTLVVEVARGVDSESLPELVRAIRRAVIDDHEVDAREVVLTRPAAIPLTTSGKVQRQACRTKLESDELVVRHRWTRGLLSGDVGTLPDLPTHVTADEVESAAAAIEAWLLGWLVMRGGVEANQAHRDRAFAEYGLDSLTAVELSGELEDSTGLSLTPVLAWNYPTPSRLAMHLAQSLAGTATSADAEPIDLDAIDMDDEDLDSLLTEIEGLGDDEL
ncbi:MAG: AMP-binding protein [Planctomycetota bacterium]